MTRTMYDSTSPQDIPAAATMVAGYVDGRYRTVAALRKRFPHARLVTITVNGSTPSAHVIDCEPGDVTAESAAAWCAREVEAGRKPTIYCSASDWSAVKHAVAARGLTGKVSYWVADWTGSPHLPAGAVACQYADPKTSGGHFDLSVAADYWPGVDPEPSPPTPKPRPSHTTSRLFKPTALALRAATAALRVATHNLSKRVTRLDPRDWPVLDAAQTQMTAADKQIQRVKGLG